MMSRFHLTSTLFFGAALLIGVLLAPPATAQERGSELPRVSPNATVSQTIGITDVRITYGRPSVRERTIFGDLVPYGEVWRTGANEATTITFSDDVTIEGAPLDAGTYGLFTIPGEERWTIIFNRTANQWGAYEYDSSEDALRVEVTPESTARSWEMMTFLFENVSDAEGQAVLYWADVRVPVTIGVNTTEAIQQRASEAVATASDWQTPFQYAVYALQNEMLLEEALQWIDRSIELEENFDNLSAKARLLAATDNYDEAISVGQRAVSMGTSMDETPRGLEDLQQHIESWQSEL